MGLKKELDTEVGRMWASSIKIDNVHARLLPMTFGKKNGRRSWNSWRRRWMR